MNEQMYSLEYIANGLLFSLHVLATEKEIKAHADNLNGTYEVLNLVDSLPSDFEYKCGARVLN